MKRWPRELRGRPASGWFQVQLPKEGLQFRQERSSRIQPAINTSRLRPPKTSELLPSTSLRLPDSSNHFLRHPKTSEPCCDYSLKSPHHNLSKSTTKKKSRSTPFFEDPVFLPLPVTSSHFQRQVGCQGTSSEVVWASPDVEGRFWKSLGSRRKWFGRRQTSRDEPGSRKEVVGRQRKWFGRAGKWLDGSGSRWEVVGSGSDVQGSGWTSLEEDGKSLDVAWKSVDVAGESLNFPGRGWDVCGSGGEVSG